MTDPMTPTELSEEYVRAAFRGIADFDPLFGKGNYLGYNESIRATLAAVLPAHEQQVRERVAAELNGRAHDAAVCHVNGPTCLEAMTLTQAAWAVRKGT